MKVVSGSGAPRRNSVPLMRCKTPGISVSWTGEIECRVGFVCWRPCRRYPAAGDSRGSVVDSGLSVCPRTKVTSKHDLVVLFSRRTCPFTLSLAAVEAHRRNVPAKATGSTWLISICSRWAQPMQLSLYWNADPIKTTSSTCIGFQSAS